MEAALVAVRARVARRFPAAGTAPWAEWWAHTREHGHGHALHYDSVPGLRDGAPPRHPAASTVTFLDADCGGPTAVFDQTVASKVATAAWVAHPKRNRLLAFDGALLHCVLPGAGGRGAAPRRTTLLINFWTTDPTAAGDVDDPEATRGAQTYPPPGAAWPADFDKPRAPFALNDRGTAAPRAPLDDVVAHLDADAALDGSADLIADGSFFDPLEILGCEAPPRGPPADADANPSSIRDAAARLRARRRRRRRAC